MTDNNHLPDYHEDKVDEHFKHLNLLARKVPLTPDQHGKLIDELYNNIILPMKNAVLADMQPLTEAEIAEKRIARDLISIKWTTDSFRRWTTEHFVNRLWTPEFDPIILKEV